MSVSKHDFARPPRKTDATVIAVQALVAFGVSFLIGAIWLEVITR